jgi:hypothetical protein
MSSFTNQKECSASPAKKEAAAKTARSPPPSQQMSRQLRQPNNPRQRRLRPNSKSNDEPLKKFSSFFNQRFNSISNQFFLIFALLMLAPFSMVPILCFLPVFASLFGTRVLAESLKGRHFVRFIFSKNSSIRSIMSYQTT